MHPWYSLRRLSYPTIDYLGQKPTPSDTVGWLPRSADSNSPLSLNAAFDLFGFYLAAKYESEVKSETVQLRIRIPKDLLSQNTMVSCALYRQIKRNTVNSVSLFDPGFSSITGFSPDHTGLLRS